MKRKLAIILSVFTLLYVTADSLSGDSLAAAAHIDNNEYVLGGNIVGIKLYSKGLICVDLGDMGSENPSKAAGIKEGDILLSANGKEIVNISDFSETVRNSAGSIKILLDRDGEKIETEITPITDGNGVKRVGLWVRDSIGGVGTVTFTDISEGQVVSLGHSVTDSDTGRSFTVRKGYITDCDVISVNKSIKGAPGEIVGRFTEDEKIYGYITENRTHGLFANSSGIYPAEEIRIKGASSRNVTDGAALLYTEIGGDGVKPYAVEIKRVFSSKSDMIVTVTDERLLSVTGGIVQGMSGSPLVQNGKLIGAVTHVFVNDPTRGYGIFIENMLAEVEKIK